MSKWWCAVGAVFAISLAACGGGGAGSCSTPAQGGGSICVDFVAGYTNSQAQQTCGTSSTSTYSAEACTSANRVGHCTISNAGFTQTESFYAPLTAQIAMDTCTSAHGTFEAN